MAARSAQSGTGLEAATRSFPADGKLIEALIARDDSFRGLCDDLAASEAALETALRLTGPAGEERRAECEGWIDSLTKEIADVLLREKVVLLSGVRRKHPT